MDLQEFNSPLPKPWLNINANSVHVGPSGGGVSSSQYDQLTTKTVVNTTAATSLSSGTTAQGSLTLPALPAGAVVKLTATGVMVIPAGQSSNFFLYINGSSVLGTAISSITVTNSGAKVEAFLAIRAGFVAPSLFALIGNDSGSAGAGAVGGAAILPAAFDNTLATNTVDLRVQHSAASGSQSFACTTFFAELVNAN